MHARTLVLVAVGLLFFFGCMVGPPPDNYGITVTVSRRAVDAGPRTFVLAEK
jgi:hypothetical protein